MCENVGTVPTAISDRYDVAFTALVCRCAGLRYAHSEERKYGEKADADSAAEAEAEQRQRQLVAPESKRSVYEKERERGRRSVCDCVPFVVL